MPRAFALLVAAAAFSGCIDLVGADYPKYVERVDKHFTISGKPNVNVSTFDGSIEIRPWDKAEVQVVVEKRATNKEAAETIQVQTAQNGDQVSVDVRVPRSEGFGIHFHFNRSAKLIVSLPATSDITAKSGDGSIDVEGLTGHVDLRSGDGSIRGRELGGGVNAHTGDGSITLTGVNGALDVDTGDGSIVASGKFTTLRARSGDGSVKIEAAAGGTAAGEWNITTGDGSVTLALPDDFGAELDAHTGDGRIHMSDFSLSNVTGQLGKNTVRGRIGGGGPSVRVRTGDGSITLKRS